jgi:hypothetical protein
MFRRGLSTKLRDRLNTVRANNYNELVNMAISQEDCIIARQAEKKRKTPLAGLQLSLSASGLCPTLIIGDLSSKDGG